MKSRIGTIVFICMYTGLVQASSNVLPRPNSESLGMADANVALASGPVAQIINPANLVDIPHGALRWETCALLGMANASFSRTTAASAASAGDFNARTTYPLVPFFAVANRWSERVVVGFSVDTPHGLSSEWKDHTWEVSLGSLGSADMVKLAQLTVIRFGPSVAWQTSENLSTGVRLFGQYVEAIDESDIVTQRADGTSLGAQIGVRYRTPGLKVGFAYTTPTNTKINGKQDNIHAAATSLVPGDINARILLPARVQTGVAFRVRPDLWWEVDLDWIGWGCS